MLRARFLDHPVEDEVILVAHPVEEVFKEFAKITDIRFLLKLETAAIVQVDTKFIRKVLCQCLNRC